MVFSNKLGNITIALSVGGAGITFALQEVIASFAGWLAVLFGGRPYSTFIGKMEITSIQIQAGRCKNSANGFFNSNDNWVEFTLRFVVDF